MKDPYATEQESVKKLDLSHLKVGNQETTKSAPKPRSEWHSCVQEAVDFLRLTNKKQIKNLFIQLSPFKDKPNWILDFIKEAQGLGRTFDTNPRKYFWGVVRRAKK